MKFLSYLIVDIEELYFGSHIFFVKIVKINYTRKLILHVLGFQYFSVIE